MRTATYRLISGRVLELLLAGPRSRTELQCRLGVSPATIRRSIGYLRDCHVPITMERRSQQPAMYAVGPVAVRRSAETLEELVALGVLGCGEALLLAIQAEQSRSRGAEAESVMTDGHGLAWLVPPL